LILKNRIPNFEKKRTLESNHDEYKKAYLEKMKGLSFQKIKITKLMKTEFLKISQLDITKVYHDFLDNCLISGKTISKNVKIYLTRLLKEKKDFFDKILEIIDAAEQI